MSRYDHTPAAGQGTDVRQCAEIYRLGILVGWFTSADAAGWAADLTSRASAIDPLLNELSSLDGTSPAAAARLLGSLAHGADADAARRVLLGILREKLSCDSGCAREVATTVVRLGDLSGDLDLYAAGYGWEDELTLADAGVFDRSEIIGEMLAELARHAATPPRSSDD